MTLRLLDRFTTQNGSWDVNPQNEYGIDQAHRDRYEAGRLIDGAGADHHIFVNVPPGAVVMFSSDGVRWIFGTTKGGWTSLPMFHDGSAYNSANGVGPWRVRVDSQVVAEGIGLPDGLHVSTFLVVGESSSGPTPVEPPGQGMSAIEALQRAQNYGAQMQQLIDYAIGELDKVDRETVSA